MIDMISTRMILILLCVFLSVPNAQADEARHALERRLNDRLNKDELTGDSIYHLESAWQNHDNATVRFDELYGRPRVIAMVYTFCPHVCPLIVSDMMKIRQELPDPLKSEVGFVLVSIDPERDTPDQLKSFARKRSLDDTWTLLTSDEDSVLELAVVLGVKYKKVSDGEFSHSNLISLVDAEGVLQYQQIGLNQDPKELVERLKGLFKQ